MRPLKIIIIVLLFAVPPLGGQYLILPSAATDSPAITGVFLQLNPDLASRQQPYWDGLFEKIAALGAKEVIVQYLADGEAVYFRPEDPEGEPRKIFPVLDRIFAAAESRGISLILGLELDPNYWTEITASPKVLRDYFLVRVARNLHLQKELLDRFGDRSSWTGYYLPDEIDDRSWRAPERRKILEMYFEILTGHLRAADSSRPVAVSAFFRSRTEPALFSRILWELTGKYFDRVLVQDGSGGGDPEPVFLPLYYRALREAFPEESNPRLSAVVEVFEQTSGPDEDFTARPADPALVAGQLNLAAEYFSEIYLFSVAAYLDPDLSQRSQVLYRGLRPVSAE